MGEMPTIEVTPIFGWGWVIGGVPRFEVPAPFTMGLEDTASERWQGIVLDDGHEFQGHHVTLSQRHIEWTGNVNIEVSSSDQAGKRSTGFGMLATLRLTTEG